MSAIAPDLGSPTAPARPVQARSVLARLLRRPQAVFGLVVIAIIALAAIAAPLVAPYDPQQQFFEGLTLEGAPLAPDGTC